MILSIIKLSADRLAITFSASTGATPVTGNAVTVFHSSRSGITFSTCMTPSSPLNNGVTNAHNPENCLESGGFGLMTFGGQAQILNGLDVWSAGQSFFKGDYIVHNDIPYQCNTSHTSSGANEPPNVSFWTDDS